MNRWFCWALSAAAPSFARSCLCVFVCVRLYAYHYPYFALHNIWPTTLSVLGKDVRSHSVFHCNQLIGIMSVYVCVCWNIALQELTSMGLTYIHTCRPTSTRRTRGPRAHWTINRKHVLSHCHVFTCVNRCYVTLNVVLVYRRPREHSFYPLWPSDSACWFALL